MVDVGIQPVILIERMCTAADKCMQKRHTV